MSKTHFCLGPGTVSGTHHENDVYEHTTTAP